MNTNYLSSPTSESTDYSLPLMDTMDSAIGETATVMGAMMTEVLRRALRGGVKQLGEELNTYAQNRVDATIGERMPALEQRAAEVADLSARTAATEVATEEVRALEVRTREASQQLAERLDDTSRTLQEHTEETARHLAERIEQTEAATSARAQELAGRIDHTEEVTAARARELAAEIERTERQSRQTTQETAEQLSSKIEETQKRVEEAFQAELGKQVEELLYRSRKGNSVLRARLVAMQETTERLLKQLLDEQSERRTEAGALRGEIQQRAGSLLEQLEREGRERREDAQQLRAELTRSGEERQARLEKELAELRQTNQKLRGRIEELEKPRGLRALFAWMFGSRKKKQRADEED